MTAVRRFSTSLGRDLLVAPRAGFGEGPDPVGDQVAAHVIAGGGDLGGVAVQLVVGEIRRGDGMAGPDEGGVPLGLGDGLAGGAIGEGLK